MLNWKRRGGLVELRVESSIAKILITSNGSYRLILQSGRACPPQAATENGILSTMEYRLPRRYRFEASN